MSTAPAPLFTGGECESSEREERPERDADSPACGKVSENSQCRGAALLFHLKAPRPGALELAAPEVTPPLDRRGCRKLGLCNLFNFWGKLIKFLPEFRLRMIRYSKKMFFMLGYDLCNACRDIISWDVCLNMISAKPAGIWFLGDACRDMNSGDACRK